MKSKTAGIWCLPFPQRVLPLPDMNPLKQVRELVLSEAGGAPGYGQSHIKKSMSLCPDFHGSQYHNHLHGT